MDKVRELGLSKNTYVIYTTDNGPWLPFKHHGGSAGPLRDGKGTTFEGGQRVPCVMWAPGRIPANSECHELMGTIDLLPTIAALTETPLPVGQKIDGLNASSLLVGDKKSPRNEFLYYTSRGDLEGIRKDKWKLLVKKKRKPRNAGKNWKAPAPEILLFDIIADMGEKTNLANKHPQKVQELTGRMENLDAEITKNAREPWYKQ
jgi:arylsulfatase A-like enzyme